MEGSWRGTLRFAITDAARLDASALGVLDRLAWKMTAWSERILGPPTMETRVAITGTHVVAHETRLSKLGMPLAWGAETITIDPDGARLTMKGSHRFAWAPWTTRAVEGDGFVHAGADGASYDFAYLGAPIAQQTQRDGEHALVVTQESAFGRSEVRLVRRVRP
jgi:hypothetical protein